MTSVAPRGGRGGQWGHRLPWVGSAWIVVALALLGTGPVSAQKQRGARTQSQQSIEVLVDGQVRRTWAGEELAAKQFTDRQPKGGFRQMINLTDALPLEGLGVSRESLVAVVIQGGGRSLELKGAAIEHLESLRLQIDSDKGGAWKLVAKGPDEERVLGPLVGVKRVVIQGVRRIELLTGASLPPKS